MLFSCSEEEEEEEEEVVVEDVDERDIGDAFNEEMIAKCEISNRVTINNFFILCLLSLFKQLQQRCLQRREQLIVLI